MSSSESSPVYPLVINLYPAGKYKVLDFYYLLRRLEDEIVEALQETGGGMLDGHEIALDQTARRILRLNSPNESLVKAHGLALWGG